MTNYIIVGIICFLVGFLISEAFRLRDLIEFRKYLKRMEDLQRKYIRHSAVEYKKLKDQLHNLPE